MSGTTPLYRPEAFAHARRRAYGTVMIAQPLALRSLTLLLVLITLAMVAFLFFGEYARKVTVDGYIEPTSGIARVHASSPGVVTRVVVSQGDRVAAGDALVVVRQPRALDGGEDVHDRILAELGMQNAELVESIEREARSLTLRREWLAGKLDALENQLLGLNGILDIKRRRSRIAAQRLEAGAQLRKNGHVAEVQILLLESEYLEHRNEEQTILRQIAILQDEISAYRFEAEMLTSEHDARISELRRRISELSTRMADARSRSEYVIESPIAGTIAATDVQVGAPIATDRPVISVLPLDVQLHAVLLIPSRAAGFLAEGQRVRLMYDSFPYQQFGTHGGSIASLSSVVLAPGDPRSPVAVREPVYIARASLDRTSVTAFGKDRPLQPDMVLRSDIVLEKRSIWNWVFEPLYALKGRT